ncbi:hypothetical protein [Sphingobium baderi]|jgi:hypothetical protein|uniref:Uncharacterized protein n=1 Tax=Sphingobium baderi TaxID=1332080 RepID=A0A0S3F1Y7_9SPHN|nr:hypothetical protein [Sphingobium baderi]ALR21660.1 hypothetical protein ATN00_16510 [Sphingobium baderi]
MSLTLIALAAAVATHTVQIDHRGAPVEATYAARADIKTRTVGAHTPNRADMRRCHWKATVMVDRQLSHSPSLTRAIPTDREFSGSEAGACTSGRDIGVRQMAKYQDQIRVHLMTVAQQDHAPLLAELDAIYNLASN